MIDFYKFSAANPCEFEGFKKISEMIKDNCAIVPAKPGVYIVVSETSDQPVIAIPSRDLPLIPYLQGIWIN